jgi:hypothetical protein
MDLRHHYRRRHPPRTAPPVNRSHVEEVAEPPGGWQPANHHLSLLGCARMPQGFQQVWLLVRLCG